MNCLILNAANNKLNLNDESDNSASNWRSSIDYKWPGNRLGWKEGEDKKKCTLHLRALNFKDIDHESFESFKKFRKIALELKQQKGYLWVKQRFNVLKSNAQKAYRLNNMETCVKTTMLVLSTDDSELMQNLVKRWFIIPLEDGCISPFILYFLFYFLAMQKGYRLNELDKFIIVQCVAILSRPNVVADWRCDFALNEESKEVKVNEELRSLLPLALQIKACYGGLHGDMQLLFDVRKTFLSRLQNNSKFPECFSQDMELWNQSKCLLNHSFPDISLWDSQKDEILTSVDHHCSNLLDYFVQTCKLDDELKSKMGNLVWDQRSSLRIRKCTCGNHPDDEVKSGKGESKETNPSWWKELVKPKMNEICEKEWKYLFLQNWTRQNKNENNNKRKRKD